MPQTSQLANFQGRLDSPIGDPVFISLHVWDASNVLIAFAQCPINGGQTTCTAPQTPTIPVGSYITFNATVAGPGNNPAVSFGYTLGPPP